MSQQFALFLFLLFSFPICLNAKYRMGTDEPIKMKETYEVEFENMGEAQENAESLEKGLDSKNAPVSESLELSVLKDLSKQFRVPIEKLSYYRSLNYGFRELVTGLFIHQETQVEVGKIFQFRLEGESWDQICQHLYLDPKEVRDTVKTLLAPIKQKLPDDRIEETPKLLEGTYEK